MSTTEKTAKDATDGGVLGVSPQIARHWVGIVVSPSDEVWIGIISGQFSSQSLKRGNDLAIIFEKVARVKLMNDVGQKGIEQKVWHIEGRILHNYTMLFKKMSFMDDGLTINYPTTVKIRLCNGSESLVLVRSIVYQIFAETLFEEGKIVFKKEVEIK